MDRIKVAILGNEDPGGTHKWELACRKMGIFHKVINLTSAQWFEQLMQSRADFFLLRPPGAYNHYKALYDERAYIISKVLGLVTFPSFEECFIYENKRLLSYYLRAQEIPHPETHVFYNKDEALDFIQNQELPIVAKTAIGSSGSGVQIVKEKAKAKKYINTAFSKKGIKRRFGPNRVIGSPRSWLTKTIKSPSYFLKKLKQYTAIYSYGERDFVIFQDYVPHDFEWRVAKIGHSYFGHKKIKHKDKASGSKGIDYVNPPVELLNFVKAVCDRAGFNCMAVDLFEDGRGSYLVNELQTIFGHVQDHIMEFDGQPGRYLFRDNQWVFEEGDFNTNESYDLRLKTAIELYKAGRI